MAITAINRDFIVKAGALVQGTSFVNSSTGQTSTLQVNGGAAIAKNLIVGTTATIWGNQSNYGDLTIGGLTTLQGLIAGTSTVTTLQVTGPSLFQGQTLFTGAVNTFSGSLFITGTNILTVGTGATNLGGTLTVAGVTSITNNTAADSGTDAGALVVTGGILTKNNLVVESTAYNTATNTANAIYTPGGIYADGGLTIGSNGPVLFKGPVTFSGTATYVLSTQTVYTDNILNLHVPPDGIDAPWTFDDGKDIGLKFHYYTNSTDTHAALVLANDSKFLEFYSTGAEGTSTFSGSSYGVIKTGNFIAGRGIRIGSFANSTATLAGEKLTVFGGAYITGTVTATTFVGALSGTSTFANNLIGGVAGSLPYQSAPDTTALLPIGTNGQILTVLGGNPAWAPVSGLSAGNATTATNIAGGLTNQIPYQTAPGQTSFSSALRFDGTDFTTTNIVVSGTSNSTGYNNGTGALQVKGGAAINNDLWVGGDINLQGSLFLKGVGLDQITGSTGTFDFLIVEGTGTSLAVSDGTTIGGITTVTNTTAVSSTNTGALQVRGGVGVAGGLFVGGAITGTSANITGNQTIGGNLTVTGYETVSGGATISALTVTNAATVGTSLAVTGFSSLNGGATASALTVTNAATVGTSLAVTGFSSLNGGATISAATVTNNLSVGGNETVTGYLTVNGGSTISALTVTNAVTIGTSLGVTGFSSLNGGATISAATVTNNLNVGGNLQVTGYSTVGLLTATIFTATSSRIIGNETVGGNLQVTGLFTATGASTFGSTVSIAGITSITNTTDSNAVNNGALVVSGGVGVAKSLTVGEDVTVGTATTQTVFNSFYSNNTLLGNYTSQHIVTNSLINLDTWSASAYRTAKYLVQVVDGTKIHVQEMLVFHDGTNVYMTEYAVASSQGELGAFDATLSAGTITIKFQANYTPTLMTIKVSRQTITL